MNDLRTERRRLKRERVRAIMAIRRAKGTVGNGSSGVVVSDSSGSSSSETSASVNEYGELLRNSSKNKN